MIPRVDKLIINMENGSSMYITCAWDTCDHRAVSTYRHRQCEHVRGLRCDLVDASGGARGRHIWFGFCNERHRAYWLNGTGANAHESIARTGRAHGNLPVGMRVRK